jgi:putative transposase
MSRLRTLGRAVADAGMGNLLSTLAYKADWHGVDLHIADRWYPSSKTCSQCGHVKDRLLISERTFECEQCGLVVDRDVNAAVNLARWPEMSEEPPLEAAA